MANLQSFVRSAEAGGFSAAARRLGLSPAAVSRNVAMLEHNLGVRLFQRSTRRLTLTETGESFLRRISGSFEDLQAAIQEVSTQGAEPAGTLKVSMAPSFGTMHMLPLLPDLKQRFPLIRPEWHFENRQVDLIAEGYDAAIGGGFELASGLVSRPLAPAHIVAVASPEYRAGRARLTDPSDLSQCDGIVMRSARTGRVRVWTLRNAAGQEIPAPLGESIVVDDPNAMREAALLGLGVALLAVPDVLPHLESGQLRRILPRWYADAGQIALYYPSRKLLPGKTRAFIDLVVEHFRTKRLAERMAGSVG